MSQLEVITTFPSERIGFISGDQMAEVLDYSKKIAFNKKSSTIGYVGACLIAVGDLVAAVVFDAPPVANTLALMVASLCLNEGIEGRRHAADLSDELSEFTNKSGLKSFDPV